MVGVEWGQGRVEMTYYISNVEIHNNNKTNKNILNICN